MAAVRLLRNSVARAKEPTACEAKRWSVHLFSPASWRHRVVAGSPSSGAVAPRLGPTHDSATPQGACRCPLRRAMTSRPSSAKTAEYREGMKTDVRPDVMKVLADRHREFLRFFEPRVDSRVATEELLQTAFVKAL